MKESKNEKTPVGVSKEEITNTLLSLGPGGFHEKIADFLNDIQQLCEAMDTLYKKDRETYVILSSIGVLIDVKVTANSFAQKDLFQAKLGACGIGNKFDDEGNVLPLDKASETGDCA